VSPTATAVRFLALPLLIAAAIAGTAITDANQPVGRSAAPTAAVGRAAFSYLSGIRAFIAYALWNRIEPLEHRYYENRSLAKSYYVIPTMRIVTLLKPDFTPPYYILPWILAENGKTTDAKALASEGVANNPHSGLLLVSYAQLLALKLNDWPGAVPYADRAMRADTYWADDTERWQSLRIAEDVFTRAGQTEKAKALAASLDALSAQIGAAPPADASGNTHDHNGDGIPDH
jgi:hypothetical protein